MEENVNYQSKNSDNINTRSVSKKAEVFRREMTKIRDLGFNMLSPVAIIEAEDLTSSEKILLINIISLSYNEGYCWASNKYLADKLRISDRQVQSMISSLESKKYIKRSNKTTAKGSQRRIAINIPYLKVKTIKLKKGRDFEKQKRAEQEMGKQFYGYGK